MRSLIFYALAAVAEIAGCFAFWAWVRLGKSALWVAPGVVALLLFAFFLTRIDAVFAGRAYAAYGGVYIAASLLWIWADLGGVSGLTVGRLAGPNLAGAKMPSATTEWFTPLWLAGLLVPGASRLIQLAGLVSGLRQRDTHGPILFMFVVALYFLVVNGPTGYARYMLPMNPAFIVLFVAGLAALGLLDSIQEVPGNQLRHSG